MKILLLTALLALTACTAKTGKVTDDAPGIMGGEASTDLAKSVVMIYNVSDEGVSSCSGTIISKTLILTAAHCTAYNPKQLIVAFGADAPLALSGKFDEKMFRRVFAGRTTKTWPTLDPRSGKNWGDVAVLKLLGKIPDGFEPVEFVDDELEFTNGMDVVLAGYGTTDDGKFEADGTPVEQGTSAESLNQVTVTMRDASYSESEVVMEQKDGRGGCHGDSGGPAFVEVEGKLMQFGIASRTTSKNGSCVDGLIYTKANNFAKFILNAAKELAAMTKPEPIPQPWFL